MNPAHTAVDPSALSCQELSVSLQGQPVLHRLTLKLAPGCWTAIVGPNGAGKSTLLRALAGLIPSLGSVQLLGRPFADWPRKARAQALAWLGQNESSGDELSAHDVVLLGRLPHRAWLAAPSERDQAVVTQALQATQAWDLRARRLGALSGGERQRVLLARLLATQAPLLLMDEPLAHLDPPHQADWLDCVRELVAQDRTVISVLHELNVALQADELVVMADGLVHHQGAPGDPATHRALQAVFDDRLQILQVQGQWIALPFSSRPPPPAHAGDLAPVLPLRRPA